MSLLSFYLFFQHVTHEVFHCYIPVSQTHLPKAIFVFLLCIFCTESRMLGRCALSELNYSNQVCCGKILRASALMILYVLSLLFEDVISLIHRCSQGCHTVISEEPFFNLRDNCVTLPVMGGILGNY